MLCFNKYTHSTHNGIKANQRSDWYLSALRSHWVSIHPICVMVQIPIITTFAAELIKATPLDIVGIHSSQ